MKFIPYIICAATMIGACASQTEKSAPVADAKPAEVIADKAQTDVVADPPSAPIAGGYAPADEADPLMKEARELAIRQLYTVYPSVLHIASITSETQVVAGTNYRFLMTMKGGEAFNNRYEIVVFRDLKGVMQVTTLKRVDQ